MRRLTVIVAILALIYSGYWFVGSRLTQSGLQSAIDAAAADGWQIDTAQIKTRGFPSRFDTTVTQLDLVSPDQLFRWQAPFVQTLSLSYQPNKIIAILPDEQTVDFAGQSIQIDSNDMRASAAVVANSALSFEKMTADAGLTAIRSDQGWSIGFDSFLAAVRAGEDTAYDVFADIAQIQLPPEILSAIDRRDVLADMIDNIVIDGTVTLDRPLDRHILPQIEADPPKIEAINIKRFNMVWGMLNISGDGALAIDTSGVPEGVLRLKTAQWQQMIDVAKDADLIDSRAATTLKFLAGSMVQDGVLTLPIQFQDGFVSLGPVPIGPAPNFARIVQ